jgi:hypothetical protein
MFPLPQHCASSNLPPTEEANGNAVCIARREVGERRQLAVGEPFGTDGGANSWRLPAGRAARQGRAAPTGARSQMGRRRGLDEVVGGGDAEEAISFAAARPSPTAAATARPSPTTILSPPGRCST